MGFLKSIRGFFVSIYQRLKEKIISGYEFISGKFKRIKNWIVDTSTGEVIEEIQPKNIIEALKMFLIDSVCGYGTSSKPSTLKEKAVKALKFFGLGFAASTALIVLTEGIVALSFIYLLNVMAFWYLCSLIFQAVIYQNKSFEWAFDKAPVSNGIVEGEVLAITYDEAVAFDESFMEDSVGESVETLVPEEKLQAGLEALASFVAKYSSKGSLTTANIMYMAFVCDPNTLPEGHKAKLRSFSMKHYEELITLSLNVEGTELIPAKQYRSFCKERMFTKDSTYSKARYSSEFYEMVKNSKF